MTGTAPEENADLSPRSRLLVALPLGAAITVLSWFAALSGVHVYDADWLGIALFPAAFAGPLALPFHLAQSVGYAFLIVSAVRMPDRSRYRKILLVLVSAHVGLGLLFWFLLALSNRGHG